MKNWISQVKKLMAGLSSNWSVYFIGAGIEHKKINIMEKIKTTIKILWYWKYQIATIFLVVLFWFLLGYATSQVNIVEAQDNVTPAQVGEYLKVSANNYKVFDQPNKYIYNEIYRGHCNLENLVEQRFDSYCLQPSVLHDHVTGRQPALACCQKYGIDWHRSLVIYLKNTSVDKPFYPGWEEALQNSAINPDMLPVPSGLRYGFSDWERGGPLYQWMLYNDAVELVTFYDSGEYEKVINIIESDNLAFQDQVYRDFLTRAKNGEFLDSVNNAKDFLQEIKLRGLEIQQPDLKIPQRECSTCK